MRDAHRLAFPILGDPGLAWARELSMTFALPQDLREVYGSFDIDLPTFNGDDSWELPLPARLVVDGEGILRALDTDPDYTRRPEPGDTLEVLRNLG